MTNNFVNQFIQIDLQVFFCKWLNEIEPIVLIGSILRR